MRFQATTMKQFEVPFFFQSPIISKVKAKRKLEDPRKKDFTPTQLTFGRVTFFLARHFGFCYGVENAIEKSYDALKSHPDKRIFLLSQMIHNPTVNDDLKDQGIIFLQDTEGNSLFDLDELTSKDIIIIPAFGTTVELANDLRARGLNIDSYNTTCPFVEKVWNRSEKLGETDHTIIIHGKFEHEETRATFSHSKTNGPSLVLKNMDDAIYLGKIIQGDVEMDNFYTYFEGKYSKDFDPNKDLKKLGVVNQTTMLASETEAITSYLRSIMLDKYGENQIKEHMADTRDTLCYATNDNQSSTYALMEESLDLAVVVGGYNSSNTTHLVELLEQKFTTYFINSHQEIISKNEIHSYDIHQKFVSQEHKFLPEKDKLNIAITSGASCPDAVVDEVMQRILHLAGEEISIESVMNTL